MSSRTTRAQTRGAASQPEPVDATVASAKKRKASTAAAKKRAQPPTLPPDADENDPEQQEEQQRNSEAPANSPSARRRPRRRIPTYDQLRDELDAWIEKARAVEGTMELMAQRSQGQVVPRRDSVDEEVEAAEGSADDDDDVLHLPKTRLKRKKPNPWTKEEENYLINLISEHGPRWSDFEGSEGRGELFGRNQTAMKDKARNIMRQIIDAGKEKDWLKKFPKWKDVSVGTARRGVHAYQHGPIPERQAKEPEGFWERVESGG